MAFFSKYIMTEYTTSDEVFAQAQKILNKTLRDLIPPENIAEAEAQILKYGTNRKGLLGEFIEWYLFGKKPDGRSEADFAMAGVELKTNPLKRDVKKKYISKERLVFSMINYDEVVGETWETSSFLKKNKVLVIMFYLWTKEQGILDHEFKFVHLLKLLEDISDEDIFQIRKDWEFIVAKIKRNEAHLLSEGDTYYLGACTKAKNSKVLREYAQARTPAKPRAFSFKQQYLNYLIQKKLLGRDASTDSIFKKKRRIETVEDAFREKFAPYIGKTDVEIRNSLGWGEATKAKSYKRMLVNKILGVSSNKIEELEKANITLKVITLEHTGSLRESMSFPAFDYKELVNELWYDEANETMSEFHYLLETQKFLFVIFQKIEGSTEIIFKKVMFWNFPMVDLPEARRVWEKTIDCINDGRYVDMPKMIDSPVAHVRPHGANGEDKIETPQHTREMRRCFWLNAKYIQKAIEDESKTGK